MKERIKGVEKHIKKMLSTCTFFYSIAKSERKSYPVLIVLCIFFGTLAPFVNIFGSRWSVAFLMASQNEKAVICILFIVFGNLFFGIVQNIIYEERMKCEDWFSRKFEMMLSKKVMKMEFINTEKAEAIEAERKAETGMSWYSDGIKGMTECVITVCSSMLTFLGVVWILTRISLLLILLSAISVIVNAVVIAKINREQQIVFEKTPKINKFYSYIYQRIMFREFAKELRLYFGNKIIRKKSMDNAKELNVMDNQCASKQLKWSFLGIFVTVLVYGFTYFWLGSSVVDGEIAVSDLVMCVAAIDTLTNNCLNRIIQSVQNLFVKSDFMRGYVDFMEYKDADNIGTIPFIYKDVFEVEFRDVFFKYPGATEYIFEKLNLKIRSGEKIALVGVNGAGKTTLVKLLCGLYKPEGGTILVNGRSISEYVYTQYIEAISVVFQDFKLFSFSLENNIRLGFDSKKDDKLDYVLNLSGIEGRVKTLPKGVKTLLYRDYDEEGVEPSGGEAQKIALARALYRDTPIVILDEPTAALDPMSEYEIYNHFNDMVHNKTCVYISHRLSSCRFADRIVVLSRKGIVEDGGHDELLERGGFYAQMYLTQAKLYSSK